MFRINGEEWRVLATYKNHPKLKRQDGTYSVASCDDETKTIYVDKTLYGSFLKKVLAHEITHAAIFSYNVDLSYDQEELLADLIATYGDEIIQITNTVFSKIKNGA